MPSPSPIPTSSPNTTGEVPLPFSLSPFPPPPPRLLVLPDNGQIGGLLRLLLSGAGIGVKEAAQRLNIQPSSIYQYLNGRRANPTLSWLARFAAVCGAKVIVEFPK